MKLKRSLRITIRLVAILFIVMNLLAFSHAYSFTHFTTNEQKKTKSTSLTWKEKVGILCFGISNPRPNSLAKPSRKYETITLQSNKEIECWHQEVKNPKGTVIIFHGYGGQKATMLDKSREFLNQGYNTLLVDFMGSGNSEGNQTTIGFMEAEQVKTCLNYLKREGVENIYLFGTSMGAVAILKAIHDFNITPKGIIIECPFGSMYKTTCARFKSLGVPAFPMAGALLFWGSVQNDFWAFGHHPISYAKRVKCPTLLLYGQLDKNVSRSEIDAIYENLEGKKTLKIYPKAGHENYLNKYKKEWRSDVRNFLHENN